jgi:hypothetical protein
VVKWVAPAPSRFRLSRVVVSASTAVLITLARIQTRLLEPRGAVSTDSLVHKFPESSITDMSTRNPLVSRSSR